MFVFISSHPLCYPGCGGWPHFQGVQEHFRDPRKQAESQHCLFDRLSLPKHLDGAPDKRCSEKELAARPAADEEFEQHREHRGKGVHYFQWRERRSQKMPQIWRSFIEIQSQHIYLQRDGGKTRINWLDFERSCPNLVAKSSQIEV